MEKSPGGFPAQTYECKYCGVCLSFSVAGIGLLDKSPGSVSPLHTEENHGRRGGQCKLLATLYEGKEEEEEEGNKAEAIMLPTMPSEAEVEAHKLTHCPYRAWCEECVMGAGVSSGHRGVGGVGEVPVVSIDYMFLGTKEGKENEDKENPILVGIDSRSGTIFAHIVKEKGAQ